MYHGTEVFGGSFSTSKMWKMSRPLKKGFLPGYTLALLFMGARKKNRNLHWERTVYKYKINLKAGRCEKI